MMKMCIDRIEGTKAVLISMDDQSVQLSVPLKLLPPGCREGEILLIAIERDFNASRVAKERAKNLIEKLKKRK
jgi:hypothetical protein